MNEGGWDRITRLMLGEGLLLVAMFWTTGMLQLLIGVFSVILLLTGISGFCLIYTFFGMNTCSTEAHILPLKKKILLGTLLIAIFLGGFVGSNFLTKKIFLEDFQKMNNAYKQALYNTGLEKKSESEQYYATFVMEFRSFEQKYQTYHPYAIVDGSEFEKQLGQISTLISLPEARIVGGDLSGAHTNLEAIRPVFQEMLKQNGFSLLSVSLVDFHDAMEKIISASDAQNSDEVLRVYPEVSEKLRNVESLENDAEIVAIRQNLETLMELARMQKSPELSKQAGVLKKSFVSVYLKRG